MVQLCDSRDNSGYSADARDLIRLKAQVRTEFAALEDDMKEIAGIISEEAEKKSVSGRATHGVTGTHKLAHTHPHTRDG